MSGELVPGRLLQRQDRFVALVQVGGKEGRAHVPNSGRMKELLYPGAPVMLRKAGKEGRKTGYDLLFAFDGSTPVAIDSQLPNRLLARALEEGGIPELGGYTRVKREPARGRSRFDLALTREGTPPCLVEIKSVNLVTEGTALFPDAPTTRGQRHLEELAQARQEGFRSVLYFLVMREDAREVRPHDAMDPLFGQALRRASRAGVEIMARACRLDRFLVKIGDPLAVKLD